VVMVCSDVVPFELSVNALDLIRKVSASTFLPWSFGRGSGGASRKSPVKRGVR